MRCKVKVYQRWGEIVLSCTIQILDLHDHKCLPHRLVQADDRQALEQEQRPGEQAERRYRPPQEPLNRPPAEGQKEEEGEEPAGTQVVGGEEEEEGLPVPGLSRTWLGLAGPEPGPGRPPSRGRRQHFDWAGSPRRGQAVQLGS